MKNLFLKLTVAIAFLLLLMGETGAISSSIPFTIHLTSKIVGNTLIISHNAIPPNQVLTYSSNIAFLFDNLSIHLSLPSNTQANQIFNSINTSQVTGESTIQAPPDNSSILFFTNSTKTVQNGQPQFSIQGLQSRNGRNVLINNYQIQPPSAMNFTQNLVPANHTVSGSVNPIANVIFSWNMQPFKLFNKKTNLSYGQCITNITYNGIWCAPSTQQFNLIENFSCTDSANIIVNIPSANILLGTRPCPKWNFITSYNPSYNSPLLIRNTSINFSVIINQIATKPIIVNLSRSPVGTLNSLNVSSSNMNVGWYDNLRQIYVGYPNYRANRTLITGACANFPYVNITECAQNQSESAFNWNADIALYEKNVVPLCQKNATWSEGNIVYCAKLKNSTKADIRTLCQLQDLIDHNTTQILPGCVLNAIAGANLQYTNAQPYVSTHIHPDNLISNQSDTIKSLRGGETTTILAIAGVVGLVVISATFAVLRDKGFFRPKM